MQRPEGTECFGLKVVPFFTLFPTTFPTLFREGKKHISILDLDALKNEAKRTHGPQGLTLPLPPQLPKAPLPIYYENTSTWFVNQNFAKHLKP